MSLAKNIQRKRKENGFSQEKLAELMDVSRQAVTKWECGQTAPSSENLLKLAELLNTTPALLLAQEGPAEETTPPAPPQAAQDAPCPAGPPFLQWCNIKTAGLIALGFCVLNFIGRLVGGSGAAQDALPGDMTVLGWLFGTSPYQLPYLLGWLLARDLFWVCLAVCTIPALFGKRRFAVCGFAGFALGLQLGEAFGPDPAGAALGQGHWGWLIWGACFVLGLVAGIIMEKTQPRLPRMKKWLQILLVVLAVFLLLATLYIGWGRTRTVAFDAGACGGGYGTYIFDKYQDRLVNIFLAGNDRAADISDISALRGTQQASWEGQTLYLEFTMQYTHTEAGALQQQVRFVGHRIWFDTYRWSGAILVG